MYLTAKLFIQLAEYFLLLFTGHCGKVRAGGCTTTNAFKSFRVYKFNNYPYECRELCKFNVAFGCTEFVSGVNPGDEEWCYLYKKNTCVPNNDTGMAVYSIKECGMCVLDLTNYVKS